MQKDKCVNVVDEGIVFSNPDLVFGYCGWPSVAKAENGDLLAVYSGNRIMHICPYGKVMFQRSRDEGKTWSARSIAIDTPLDDRDAGILPLPGNKMLVSSFNNTRQQQKDWAEHNSSALGDLVRAYLPAVNDETEEKYLGSSLSFSEDDGFSFSKPFRVPVSAPHGPALLKDGSVIYAGMYFPANPITTGHKVAVFKSGDYRNFELLSEVPRNPGHTGKVYCEPHIIELPSGRLLIHIRSQYDKKPSSGEFYFTILQSVSDDRGKTFSMPKETGADGSPPHLLMHSSGTLMSVYGRRRPPYGIQVMFSKDEGETWDKDYFVWNRGVDGDLGYPASVELSNGDVLTIYYTKIFNQKSTSILWTRWRLP